MASTSMASAFLIALALCAATAFAPAEATPTGAHRGGGPNQADLPALTSCTYGNNYCGNYGTCPGGDSTCICWDLAEEGQAVCLEDYYCYGTLTCETSEDCGPGGYCVIKSCCGENTCTYPTTHPFQSNPVCPLKANACHRVTGPGNGGKSATPVCSGTCGDNNGWGCCKYDVNSGDCACQLPEGSTSCPGSHSKRKFFF